jgi:predicted amidophosphoribosyltransferase
MAGAGAGLLADAHLIVPVPLHYFRLLRRGFNQSVWLAAALARSNAARSNAARSSGARLAVDALKRTRATPIQGGLSATGRRRNVQGAFRVRRSREGLVKDQKILLVDDVLTTGATRRGLFPGPQARWGKLRRCAHTGASCGAADAAHIVLERF